MFVYKFILYLIYEQYFILFIHKLKEYIYLLMYKDKRRLSRCFQKKCLSCEIHCDCSGVYEKSRVTWRHVQRYWWWLEITPLALCNLIRNSVVSFLEFNSLSLLALKCHLYSLRTEEPLFYCVWCTKGIFFFKFFY